MAQKRLMLLGGLRYLLPVIEEAHKLGVYVITVDNLPENYAHKYSDEYCNISIIDKEAVLEKAQTLKIDGILSHAVDPGVVTAAYVAEKLNLPFQCSYESACILQDKSRFRNFLSDNKFNCPRAKAYTNFEDAIIDSEYFKWPIIVKPVDSAGSKGVTKIEKIEDLKVGIDYALSYSISKKFIIEEFLSLFGAQSSADIFAIDGQIVYPAYSDQLFDKNATNPYTPVIEIWPSSMNNYYQEDLTRQLQHLFSLLNINSGIFNVESRIDRDGKAYLMEVSPRGGGNRIAEIQEMATGQSLIRAEIYKALNQQYKKIQPPKYNGVWCNYILHSSHEGTLISIEIDSEFEKKYIKDKCIFATKGDNICSFTSANASLGTLFLHTESREELNYVLQNIKKFVKINVQ